MTIEAILWEISILPNQLLIHELGHLSAFGPLISLTIASYFSILEPTTSLFDAVLRGNNLLWAWVGCL